MLASMKNMERENPLLDESANSDGADTECVLGEDKEPSDAHRLISDAPDQVSSGYRHTKISDIEKERNFYRAKCRRLTCERDKLVRMPYSYSPNMFALGDLKYLQSHCSKYETTIATLEFVAYDS